VSNTPSTVPLQLVGARAYRLNGLAAVLGANGGRLLEEERLELDEHALHGVGRAPTDVLLLLVTGLKHVETDRPVEHCVCVCVWKGGVSRHVKGLRENNNTTRTVGVLQGGAHGDLGRIVGVALGEVEHQVEHCGVYQGSG
jgi:hypothetical protein